MNNSKIGRLYQFSVTVVKPPSGIIKFASFNLKVLIGASGLKAAEKLAKEEVLKMFSEVEKLSDCKIKNIVGKEIKYDLFASIK